MSSPFQFRHFNVAHSKSTMKVGTDAILLGSWASLPTDGNFLDIGTGSGVIALMLAQKSENARITAIDIDENSINEARGNFKNSPWQNRLIAHHSSLQDFAVNYDEKFDHIVSNPPFFAGHQTSIYPSRTKSRHTVYLNHGEFLILCGNLMHDESKLSVIIPTMLSDHFFNIAADQGLFATRILKVKPKAGQNSNRMLIEFCKIKASASAAELFIYSSDGSYTEEYQQLTEDFYL